MKLKWYQKLSLWFCGFVFLFILISFDIAENKDVETKKYTIVTAHATYQTDSYITGSYHLPLISFEVEGKTISTTCCTIIEN